MTPSDFTIGADPEFFLETSEGELRSAIGVLEGTKYNQQYVDGGGLQRDNVAAEFSCDPSNNEEEFVAVLGKVLESLKKAVAPLHLSGRSSADFPVEQLDNEEARLFGCDPDYNCWLVERNYIPDEAATLPFRSCGGHIHVGMKEKLPKVLHEGDTFMGRLEIVRAMDVYVGVTSILLDHSPESKKRRTLYGKAGAHRPKGYGVEYRALGNFWMMSPKLARLIYRLTALAVSAADSGLAAQVHKELGSEEIQRVINECDVKAAQAIFDAHVRPHLKAETLGLLEGAVGKVYDVYEEWK